MTNTPPNMLSEYTSWEKWNPHLSLDNNQRVSNILEEWWKIDRLRNALEVIYDNNYSTLGHWTTIENAIKILNEGLMAKDDCLLSTSIPLFDSNIEYEKQSKQTFESIMKWKHKDYKHIVIIMIPNPIKWESWGFNYFNGVFDESPEELKINSGFQGVDLNYVIPSHFIRWYIDVERCDFIENKKYNPDIKVERKKIIISRGFSSLRKPIEWAWNIDWKSENYREEIDDVW